MQGCGTVRDQQTSRERDRAGRGCSVLRGLGAWLLAIAMAFMAAPERADAQSDTPADRGAPASGQALRVVAAASLTEVVEALAARFPDGPVVTSFGASSDLARQIRDGAPADVLISASPDWIEFLVDAGRVVDAPVLVARNALVCIAPRSGAAEVPRDPQALAERVTAAGDLVAIADEGVPAGEYARRALAKLGLAAAFERHLVGQKDVRAVLHAVEQGEVAAGFVYSTDAKIADVEVLFAFDPANHPPIEYQAVVLQQSTRPDLARRFLAHLAGESARARLSAAGFVLP